MSLAMTPILSPSIFLSMNNNKHPLVAMRDRHYKRLYIFDYSLETERKKTTSNDAHTHSLTAVSNSANQPLCRCKHSG